jgi:signal transduction histidine kinase
MNTQSLSIPTTTSSNSTSLRGGWLLLTRLVWLVFVLIAVGLFIEGIPRRADGLREQYQPEIGVFLVSSESGEILIFPWKDYPAIQAGILEGDVLVAVNGRPIHDLPIDSLKELIQTGPAGAPVTLRVRTGNHLPREHTVFLGGEDPVALARLGLSENFIAVYVIVMAVIFALVCIGIAALIVWRKSNDWLALLASLAFVLALLGASAHVIAIYDDNPLWRPALGTWLNLILFVLLLFACLFPVGQNVPRWTLALIILAAFWTLIAALNPSLQLVRIPRPYNFLMIVGCLGAGMVIQIYQYRHSNPIQRQQTKWVVFGATSATVGVFGQAAATFWSIPSGPPAVLFDLIGYPAIQLLKLLLPLTIAVAILRYRLWDIDIIINRALVYGTLTVSVIGIYVIVVGTLGTTIQGRSNVLISILATGLVAVLVQPLRDRLQRGVNRMMYGERDDPVTVLSQLGQRLEGTLAPDAVLPSLVETVAQTLKLSYVAIETIEQRLDSPPATEASPNSPSSPTVAYGHPQPDVIRLPLIYQSETIGHLLVSPRAPSEPLSPMDRHLLENIAHQAGMAVHAVSLTGDLQRSRQRLVTTREEERRRLRRDLHDGLGPNLASQGLKLAAVKQLLEKDPASAIPLLDQVMTQNQSTVEEVRRLVYGLRPPALDELGLVAAIRDYVAGMDGKSTLQIEITEPQEGLPPLTAAIEVAAYRIVLEALTNVIRHAQAKHCAIRFSPSQNGSNAILQIEIVDDGIGLPRDLRAGVGLRSMRERAEEVGGILTIEPAMNGGTHIRARLPVIDKSEHNAL